MEDMSDHDVFAAKWINHQNRERVTKSQTHISADLPLETTLTEMLKGIWFYNAVPFALPFTENRHRELPSKWIYKNKKAFMI